MLCCVNRANLMKRYKYIGAGEFYNGIPARDLNENDWLALTDEQKKLVRQSRLYIEHKRAAAKKGKD